MCNFVNLFFAEEGDVYLYGVILRFGVVPPYFFDKPFLIYALSGAHHEHFQYLKLLFSERDLFPAAYELRTFPVYAYVVKGKYVSRVFFFSAQKRPYPREQFLGVERFGNIVVRSEV